MSAHRAASAANAPGATWPKSGIYHSDLRALTEAGPARITFTTHPRDSTFKNRNRWAGFLVDGDPTPYLYEIADNADAVAATLAAVELNVPCLVQAVGHKETAALVIHQVGPQGAVAGGSEMGAPRVQRSGGVSPGPAAAPPAPAAAPSGPVLSLAAELWDCLDASREMVARFVARHERQPTDAELRIAATLFIQHHHVPTRPVRKARKGAR